MIGNQESLEEYLSAKYVEDYMDFVENLPNELQRYLTRYREIDVEVQVCLDEIDDLRLEVVNSNNVVAKDKALDRIEQLLIMVQEMGDEKIETAQQMQDVIGRKCRQLNDDYSNLKMGFGNKRENTNKDEFADGSNFESILKSPVHSAPETVVPTKKYRRHILHKDTNMDTDSMQSSDVNSDSNAKSSNTTSDVSSNSNTGHTNTSNSKKTNTGQRRRRRRGRNIVAKEDSPNHEDELIGDPGEPTYCLCDQISFGEMILCDNDLCPHEWFHFSCVQLTIKPKGKWYCPKCRGDKSNMMKPKPLLLKALEKYNKEKEDKMFENSK